MEKVNRISGKTRNNWLIDAALFATALVTVLSSIYFLFVPSGYQGGRNPWYGVTILFNHDTWDWLHTWIGLGMIVVALVHLLIHWKWVVSMAKKGFSAIRGKGSNLNAYGKYNLAINTTIAVSFLVAAVSGVYFLFVGGSEGGRNLDPMFLFARETWDVIHTWSGILFISAGLLHFVLHWRWVTGVTRKVFGIAAPVVDENSKLENNKEKRKFTMFKKFAGIAVITLVVGLLAFGGITRTYAESDSSVAEAGLGYGNGGGYGAGSSNGNGLSDTGYQTGYHTLYTPVDSLPAGTLNQAEKDSLLYMYEEEKMARDVYTVFANLWGTPVFSNIARAEQMHMDSVKALLDRYQVTVPETGTSGVFENADLQNLYNELVSKGSVSLADALKAGGAIEEVDIMDLKDSLKNTDQLDIQTVFENLLNGSYSHLQSFASVYKVQTGTTYVPQYLTQADFDTIVTTATASQGQGRGVGGNGRGMH